MKLQTQVKKNGNSGTALKRLIEKLLGGLNQFFSRKTSILSPGAATNITKTRLYNLDPLKFHFYIVKLWFTGVYISFLISAQKHIYVLSRSMTNIGDFYLKMFSFFEAKFSIY